MTTATIERDTTKTQVIVEDAQPRRCKLVPILQVADRIADAMGGERDGLVKEILDTIEVFEVGDAQMIRPEDTDILVDAAAERLKERLRQPIEMTPTPKTAPANGMRKAAPEAKKKPAAQSVAAGRKSRAKAKPEEVPSAS